MIQQALGKSRRFIVFVVSLCILMLCGCQLSDLVIVNTAATTESASEETTVSAETETFRTPMIFMSEQDWEDGAISGMRTGLCRQGIAGEQKHYECTDERVYFMMQINGLPMLYYGTHDSAAILPLCGKRYCNHNSEKCNAYFSEGSSICYYEEYLYVTSGSVLYRINQDGSGRDEVIDVLADSDGRYGRLLEPRLWNGVFTFWVAEQIEVDVGEIGGSKAKESRTRRIGPYYYCLDGSMERPELMKSVTFLYNDGTEFIVRGTEQLEYGGDECLFRWDPEDNDLSRLLDIAELPEAVVDFNFKEGYWGTDCAYFLQDNMLYRLDYETESCELIFHTGLHGDFRMSCFPDCVVLCGKADISGKVAENLDLYVYDWNFKLLGYVKLDESIDIPAESVICGESKDRIYLALQRIGVPDAYIDKYEFGTDEFTLHFLKLHSAGIYSTSKSSSPVS